MDSLRRLLEGIWTPLEPWFLAGTRALFLDIPYIVDSFTRRADYFINRTHFPDRGKDGINQKLRSPVLRPSYLLLLVVLIFTAFGPTYNSLCGLGFPRAVVWTTNFVGKSLLILAILQALAACIYIYFRVKSRLESMDLGPWNTRLGVARGVLWLVGTAWALPLGFLGYSMLGPMRGGCHEQNHHWAPAVQVLALGVAIWIATYAARRTFGVLRLFLQACAIYLLVAMTIWTGDLTGAVPRSEALQVPYPHLFGAIAAVLATITWLSPSLMWVPFHSVTIRELKSIRAALKSTELFAGPRDDPELSFRRVVGGFFTGLLAKPLQFFVIPAFLVLLVPADWLRFAWPAGVFASSMLITAGSLTARWGRMLEYVRRYFLLGTPSVVSLAVVVIAALRLNGVQYVTTLLDVAPFGVLFLWMVMAYAVCWWFEYQVNSVLVTRVLQILGRRSSGGRVGQDDDLVPYKLADHVPSQTTAERDGRQLSGHGMGELIALGRSGTRDADGKLLPAFEATSIVGLFDKLLTHDKPSEAHEMIRRVELYFGLVNAAIVIGLGGLAWHWGRGDRLNTVEPVIVATQQPANAEDRPAVLSELLTDDPLHPKGSAIMVSASGGGTRAALYTAMTLQGLHSLHVDDRIVLLSGVSGGSVASAYFYGHRDDLVQGKSGPCDEDDPVQMTAWNCYTHRMAMPFIDDVLRGASEWRIQSDQPLGILLAESFDRRLFAGERKMTLADRSDVGLILNTTVTGHPLQDARALRGTLQEDPDANPGSCGHAVSALGGGRLAFSNLAQVDRFRLTNDEVPSIEMPFVLVRDHSIGLARAAALSANFPPVFPNARVNLTGFKTADDPCDMRSYFVTDGGATENLSLVSMLLAIQSAIKELPVDKPLRHIDIVLAEASAMQFDYTQDRGIGAATDQAKERLTGRLTLELLEQLKGRVSIEIHDLSLPRVFRSRGGFGTHWEFPGRVRLEDPLDPTSASERQRYLIGSARKSVLLDEEELKIVWNALFSATSDDFCLLKWNTHSSRDLKMVGDWICGKQPAGEAAAASAAPRPANPDPQLGRWSTFREELAAASSSASGSAPMASRSPPAVP